MKANILYVSQLMEEDAYSTTYVNSFKPGQQIQKYHRLLVKGLKENDCNVHCLTALVLSPSLSSKRIVKIRNNAEFTYITGVNISAIKNLWNLAASFFRVLFGKSYSLCLIDPLSVDNGFGSMLACKLRKIPMISIVTDLPEHMTDSNLYSKMADCIIQKSDGYVFLTVQANKKINTKNKPWCLIEGLVDSSKEVKFIPYDKRNKEIIFAGGISEENGIPNLVEAFKAWKQDSYQLRIFGNGVYEETLKESIKDTPSISYEGVMLNAKLMEIMERASLLINPRPIHQKFTNYTFPSKTMEYLSTGTCSSCTQLPGIPSEYFNYMGNLKNGSVEDIVSYFNEFTKLSDKEKEKRSLEALAFVNENKNCAIQASKIVSILKSIS